jgi:hypothetical protein
VLFGQLVLGWELERLVLGLLLADLAAQDLGELAVVGR